MNPQPETQVEETPGGIIPDAQGPGRTVCLLGATFATGNMGVNALAIGAIKCIVQNWPRAEVALLDYGRKATNCAVNVGPRTIEVPLINMRFSWKIWLPNHVLTLIALALLRRLIPSRTAKRWLTRQNLWLSAVTRAGLAVSVAGGDSFSDVYGLGRFLYVALPQLLCLAAGTRIVLLPQTLGPFRNRLVRLVAQYILRRAELVYSRDYAGVKTARKLIGLARAGQEPRFCPDLALLLDPTSTGVPGLDSFGLKSGGRSVVGMNISGLLCRSGAAFIHGQRLRADYDALIPQLIQMVITAKGAAVLLIPHVFGSGAESDAAACDRVYSELRASFPGLLGLAAGSYDQSQIKYLIGTCDFFIGSRMHACIAAVSQGVPAVSIAYSDKFIGVMETMGLKRLVADLRTTNEPEILALVGSAFDERSQYRELIEREMPGLRSSVLNLLADVNIAPTSEA